MDFKQNKRYSVTFIQVMAVTAALIAAVVFKAYGRDAFDECRLRLSNLIADKGEFPSAVEMQNE